MFLINDISTNDGFARKRFCLKSIWYIRHIPLGFITTNELPRKCSPFSLHLYFRFPAFLLCDFILLHFRFLHVSILSFVGLAKSDGTGREGF